MSQLRLGQIGIGALGSRIATKLIWSGFPLHVYDVMDVSVRMFNAEYGGMMTEIELSAPAPAPVVNSPSGGTLSSTAQ